MRGLLPKAATASMLITRGSVHSTSEPPAASPWPLRWETVPLWVHPGVQSAPDTKKAACFLLVTFRGVLGPAHYGDEEEQAEGRGENWTSPCREVAACQPPSKHVSVTPKGRSGPAFRIKQSLHHGGHLCADSLDVHVHENIPLHARGAMPVNFWQEVAASSAAGIRKVPLVLL